MKVDDVISGIMSHGEGAVMAKFDVESMYPNVPLHSDDCYLLGMKWQGNYFSNLAPPFGLPSAHLSSLLLHRRFSVSIT